MNTVCSYILYEFHALFLGNAYILWLKIGEIDTCKKQVIMENNDRQI
jgi:hypothetical protein